MNLFICIIGPSFRYKDIKGSVLGERVRLQEAVNNLAHLSGTEHVRGRADLQSRLLLTHSVARTLERTGEFRDGSKTILRLFCQGAQHHLVEDRRNRCIDSTWRLSLHMCMHMLHDLLRIALKQGASREQFVGDGGKAVLIGDRRRLTIKSLRSHVAEAYRRL